MILSFSVFKEKIENGEKRQTIRPYNEKRYRMFCNSKKYQLYWHNPRNGGKLIKEVIPDSTPIRIFFMEPTGRFDYVTVHGSNHDDDDRLNVLYPTDKNLAVADGFGSYSEMLTFFSNEYGKNMLRPNQFMIIRWLP